MVARPFKHVFTCDAGAGEGQHGILHLHWRLHWRSAMPIPFRIFVIWAIRFLVFVIRVRSCCASGPLEDTVVLLLCSFNKRYLSHGGPPFAWAYSKAFHWLSLCSTRPASRAIPWATTVMGIIIFEKYPSGVERLPECK